jgi:hypothetical protein
MIEIELKDTSLIIDGTNVILKWWTPEGADLVCSLCGECKGWRERDKNKSYHLSLTPCPITSKYCG